MKKEDNISFLLSIVINIIIILLIPGLSSKTIENKKIKIGLVAYETKARTKLEGEKNTNTSEKKVTQEIKKQENKKKEPEKKVEIKKEEKIDLSALNKLAGTISVPNTQVLSVDSPIGEFREIKNIDLPQKQFLNNNGVVKSQEKNIELPINKDDLSLENEKLNLKDDDRIAFNSEIGKDNSFDRILKISGEEEGLPSGYKLGTEDGDIVARWDSSNREPVYPESAQERGLHGTVKLRMTLNERGEVKKLILEKGSGVPEINNAIEEVARTWKIYLSKNGLNVKGDVILEYNFTLKGKK